MLEDDDDIYGPPVERRITRTFPSLADELPEKSIPRQDVAQQRRHAKLAPELIAKRYAGNSGWVIPARQRRTRKSSAKKLDGPTGDAFYFHVGDWLREHDLSH